MKHILSRPLSVIAALLINAGIIIAIPQMSGTQPMPLKGDRLHPVLLTEYRPPSPKAEKKEPEKPENQPENQKELPRPEKYPPMRVKSPIPSPPAAQRPRMEIQKPEMNFRINPLLAAGPAIAPPAPLSLPASPAREIAQPQAPAIAQAAPSPLPSPRSEFDSGEVDQSPRLLRKVEPEYPRRAKRGNIQGKVTVKFLVSSKGRVEKPEILDADPEGIFEQSVLRALTGWKFEPGYFQGKAVSTWVVLPIQFSLKG